jgi:hypothetical protein
LLAWKNYGNSHVIFDASNSTTPNGGACNNTNASVAWSGTYPTLMGWNGGSTYGVRVDSARIADSISGQANSATITASTAANGNQIVLRDGNGDDYRRYGFANYFNMDHGVSGSTGDTIFYSSTDNYIRKNNATGLRGSLNVPTRTGGDASGTWSINITGSAGSAGSASISSQVTVNYNNDSNANYQMLWGSGNSVYGTAGIYCNPATDAMFATSFQATSDETLKTNWRDLSDDFVDQLAEVKHGVFDWIENGETDAGVSAQSMQNLLAEVVKEGQNNKLTVNYGNAALVACIKLAQRVLALEQQLKDKT